MRKSAGLSKAKLDEAHKTIKNLPMKGSRFTTTVKDAKVQPIVAERMRGLDFYVETLENEFVLGLETPLAKLVTKTGFTEASANAALEIAERRVMALQRFIKRSVERHLFDRVITQAGLDSQQAQVRLNGDMPVRPEFSFADVLQAFELLAIDRDEVRKILTQLGWPLEIQGQPKTGSLAANLTMSPRKVEWR